MKCKKKSNNINLLVFFIKLICFTLCVSFIPVHSVYAFSLQSEVSIHTINSGGIFNNFFDWIFGDNKTLPECPPFYVEKGHYVYRGGDLITGYALNAPLYVESDMTVCSSISAKEIIIDAKVNIVSKNAKGQYVSNSGLISNEDIKIKKSGSLSMEKNTTIEVGRNLESKSAEDISIEQGKIVVHGNLELRNKWKSKENCIVKIDGPETHVLKGDKTCSVGMLVFSEDALFKTKIKKPFWFWQQEPELFEVVKFSIKLPDSMMIQDNSSEISKILHCMPMQSNTPYHIKNFAMNYLYTLLYCNGNLGNVSIDIFDMFFSAKTNSIHVDSISFKDEKAVYLDAQKKVHCVKVDLSYMGTRNNKNAKSIGFGEMIVNDSGNKYQFEFYPILDTVDDDLKGFIDSLRKGSSVVIRNQAKDIVIGQAISDLANISAPEIYDLEAGNVICEVHSIYKFFKDFKSFINNWNKMKNGLVLEPDSTMHIQATEEHTQAANELDENADDGNITNKIEENENVYDENNTGSTSHNDADIYKKYVAETVIPQISASNMETYTATMNPQVFDTDWGNRNGLFAMDIRDLNNDGIKELLLYICKPCEVNNGYRHFESNNGFVVDVYSINDKNDIYKVCEETLGYYGGTLDNIFGGGYSFINGKLYLLVESMDYGLLANGIGYEVDLYKFDSNACIHLDKRIFTPGGSSDIRFICQSYDGSNSTEEVFWADQDYVYNYDDNNVTLPAPDYTVMDGFDYIYSKIGIKCPAKSTVKGYEWLPSFLDDTESIDPIFRIDNHGTHYEANYGEPHFGEINYIGDAHSWYNDEFDTSATFIIPDSSDRLITDVVLQNFDAKKLELARNEIFARHGRKFKTDYIQDYFNSKAWYRGTIEPDDFDSNVFNDFEKENINFLLETENGVSEKKSPSTSAGFTPEQAQEIIFNYLYDEVSDFAGDTFGVDPGYGSRSSMEYIAYFSVGEAAYQYATVTVNLDTGDGRVQYVYDYDAEIYDAFGVWPETMIPEYDINLYDIQ